ncbi:hypothetical protein MXD59_12720 [Frankia sp. Ag45/Mut15]|uniref:DUF222 domain-containing protein n=1 Tax=Frankia umida TaxID=573489 RepID=A0ABT0JYK5_9ACTN|nr:hypothetical protein [Frankia umida]MCK9876631.1 hypothetical protein [Frankia umida]
MTSTDSRLDPLPARIRRRVEEILTRHDGAVRPHREAIIRPDGPTLTSEPTAAGSVNPSWAASNMLRAIDSWHSSTTTTIDALFDAVGDEHENAARDISGDLLGEVVRARHIVLASYVAVTLGRDLAAFRIAEDATVLAAGRRIPIAASALASAPSAPPAIRFAVDGTTDPTAVAARLREMATQVETGELAF